MFRRMLLLHGPADHARVDSHTRIVAPWILHLWYSFASIACSTTTRLNRSRRSMSDLSGCMPSGHLLQLLTPVARDTQVHGLLCHVDLFAAPPPDTATGTSKRKRRIELPVAPVYNGKSDCRRLCHLKINSCRLQIPWWRTQAITNR